MRYRKLLAIILLSLSFCFVSGAGYGKVQQGWEAIEATLMDIKFLEATNDYIMSNPTSFLNVRFGYDLLGTAGEDKELFSRRINTEDKIIVRVIDNRGIFSAKSGLTLLHEFEEQLETIYFFVYEHLLATDMDNDIVAVFYNPDGYEKTLPLGYFNQGKYHLREE